MHATLRASMPNAIYAVAYPGTTTHKTSASACQSSAGSYHKHSKKVRNMTDAKPPALFDWATELSDAQGHVTLSEQEAHEIGARLRRQHARIAELEQEVAHTDSLLGKANALARIRAHRIAELEAQLEAIGASAGSEPVAPAGATSNTHWNQAPCVHCGCTEGQHFNARCHHIQGETRYTPTPKADSQPAPQQEAQEPVARELKVMRGMASCGGDDESIQQAEIDLHRLQHIESAALLALGMLWMTERHSPNAQAAFQTLRNALGGQDALRRGIEAAIDAGFEADHPPGADWWAGKKEGKP